MTDFAQRLGETRSPDFDEAFPGLTIETRTPVRLVVNDGVIRITRELFPSPALALELAGNVRRGWRTLRTSGGRRHEARENGWRNVRAAAMTLLRAILVMHTFALQVASSRPSWHGRQARCSPPQITTVFASTRTNRDGIVGPTARRVEGGPGARCIAPVSCDTTRRARCMRATVSPSANALIRSLMASASNAPTTQASSESPISATWCPLSMSASARFPGWRERVLGQRDAAGANERERRAFDRPAGRAFHDVTRIRYPRRYAAARCTGARIARRDGDQ